MAAQGHSFGRSRYARGVAKVNPTTSRAKDMCDDDAVKAPLDIHSFHGQKAGSKVVRAY